MENFQRIIEFFTQKIVTMLSKIWVWDPGSEIRDPEKTYSRSKKALDPGSRIRNTVEKCSGFGKNSHTGSRSRHFGGSRSRHYLSAKQDSNEDKTK